MLRNLALMISFDKNGNVTPYDRIELTLQEITQHFVNDFPESTSRPILCNNFIQYVNDLHAVINASPLQWLGGSFISMKLDPNDVDCVNLISFNAGLEQNIEPLIPYLLIGGSRETYYVDGHLIAIYPPTDERYEAITIPSMAYWKTFLMNDRHNNPRGIVEIA
jgi:hypothetical protein